MEIGAMSGGLSVSAMPGLSGTASVCAATGAGTTTIDGLTPQMQALVDLMGGLTSAQILMALMMSRSKGKDEESGDPMALLLGMAMASQLSRLTAELSKLFQAGNMKSAACGTSVGTQLNVLA